jgi:hypothetical protein
MHCVTGSLRYFLAVFGSIILYGVAVFFLQSIPRSNVDIEMQVALPRFVQVVMAAGDRYLAANMAGFRVLVAVDEKMREENYEIQGKLQSDVAWLNPAHEDNYYIAAAILPWNGQLDAAQYVLSRAIDARPRDWAPIFYFAFDMYHFQHEPLGAAQWLLTAAERASDENDRIALQNAAAKWFEKGYQPAVAAQVVDGIANQSRHSGFRKYLHLRAERMRQLSRLEDYAEKYYVRIGRRISSLKELVDTGFLSEIPVDPLGIGFGVDANGKPVFVSEQVLTPSTTRATSADDSHAKSKK